MPRLPVQLCLLACCLCSLSEAQSDLPKNVLQLAQLKRRIKAAVGALPNYACLETIERSQRKNAKQPFRHIDTVHVEVAVVGDRELYSWPGANKFEDRDITEMIDSERRLCDRTPIRPRK